MINGGMARDFLVGECAEMFKYSGDSFLVNLEAKSCELVPSSILDFTSGMIQTAKGTVVTVFKDRETGADEPVY